ncbi:MAG: hypothetical protein AAGA56_01345 [Myxococcota bacterium]
MTGLFAFSFVLPWAISAQWVRAALAALPFAVSLGALSRMHRRSRLEGGTLELSDRLLVYRGERLLTVPLDTLAWGARLGSEVSFETRNGRRIAVELKDERKAAELLVASGFDIDQRSITLRGRRVIGPFVSGLLVGMLVFTAFSIMLSAILARFGMLGWAAPISIVLAIVAARLYVAKYNSPTVTLGIDGITLKTGGKSRFVPYVDIASLVRNRHTNDETQIVTHTLQVVLHDGEVLRLPVIGWSEADLERVELRFREARRRAEGAATERGEGFARRGRDLLTWRIAVSQAVAGGAGFRRRRIEVADAESTLADPTSPPDARVGAAMAPHAVEPAGARFSVARAARATADEKMQQLLRASLDDEAAIVPRLRSFE